MCSTTRNCTISLFKFHVACDIWKSGRLRIEIWPHAIFSLISSMIAKHWKYPILDCHGVVSMSIHEIKRSIFSRTFSQISICFNKYCEYCSVLVRYPCDGYPWKQCEITCTQIRAMFGHSVSSYGKLEHWVSKKLLKKWHVECDVIIIKKKTFHQAVSLIQP